MSLRSMMHHRRESLRVGLGWLHVRGRIGRSAALPYFQAAVTGYHHWPINFRGYVSQSDPKPWFVWPKRY